MALEGLPRQRRRWARPRVAEWEVDDGAVNAAPLPLPRCLVGRKLRCLCDVELIPRNDVVGGLLAPVEVDDDDVEPLQDVRPDGKANVADLVEILFRDDKA